MITDTAPRATPQPEALRLAADVLAIAEGAFDVAMRAYRLTPTTRNLARVRRARSQVAAACSYIAALDQPIHG